jgi:hypothetical protein
LTSLVFNVQTANFDAAKTFTTTTDASREHWKSNLAFSCQLLRHFPRTLPGLFEQNPAKPLAKHRPTHFKNYLDGKPALTLPSGALARLTKTFANHQVASRPRHRASVGWMGC